MNKSQSKYFNTAARMDDALLALLEKKPFAYITVSEICKTAHVNRSTFYLHYENLNDLLVEASRRTLDGFLAYFPHEQKAAFRNVRLCELNELNYITEDYLTPYLSYIRENRQIFSTVLSHQEVFGTDSIFQNLFQNVFNPILERFHYPPGHREYVMKFYLNGINAVVLQWIQDGCSRSIPEISEIIRECIFGLHHKSEPQ